jgi:spore maturation protein CgeB
MRVAIFCHSTLSDWNNGSAHFLRGIATELALRGHRVRTYEPEHAWSVENLIAEHGAGPLRDLLAHYPRLDPVRYAAGFEIESVLDEVDVVLVHDWSDPTLVARIGRHRARGGRYRLFFHDTNERADIARNDLSGYDGVLAYGESLRDAYDRKGWGRHAFTWHEAADLRHFGPIPGALRSHDLIWIGNGDDLERGEALAEYLLLPARELGLRARIHGVRHSASALAAFRAAKVEFAGWLPNYAVPVTLAQARFTVHVPRRSRSAPATAPPSIGVFEALACGVPLISARWRDADRLFEAGVDYLVADDTAAVIEQARLLLQEPALRRELAAHALATVRANHTCGHRVEELLGICASLDHRKPIAPPLSSRSTNP